MASIEKRIASLEKMTLFEGRAAMIDYHTYGKNPEYEIIGYSCRAIKSNTSDFEILSTESESLESLKARVTSKASQLRCIVIGFSIHSKESNKSKEGNRDH